MNLGLDIRKEVLSRALLLESLTSIFVGGLLGIKNIENSRTLGNKGTSLSFNNKVDLLIDIGALDSKNKKKFQAFMEIRNQFMHNLEASSYCKCFNYLLDTERFILKTYSGKNDLDRETALRNATLNLAEEILKITAELIEKVKDKIRKEVEGEFAKESNNFFIKSLKETQITIDALIESLISKKDTLTTEELREFGKFLNKALYLNANRGLKL